MDKRTCSVEGCDRPVIARGLCNTDWKRARRSGELAPLAKPTLEERFWAKVDRRGPDEYWPWLASLHEGYGQIMINDRPVGAHRVAYELLVGPIPEGMDLDHLCHTRDTACRLNGDCPHRRCCNPAHLEPVTRAENSHRGHSPVVAQALATHCVNGHEWTPANTWIRREGTRVCRACNRTRERQRRKAARSSSPT